MRLDAFLANSGRLARRTVAKRACDEGLVELDGKPAKAATAVSVGQQVTLRTGLAVRTYRILALPERPVPRDRRDDYSELVSSQAVMPDSN